MIISISFEWSLIFGVDLRVCVCCSINDFQISIVRCSIRRDKNRERRLTNRLICCNFSRTFRCYRKGCLFRMNDNQLQSRSHANWGQITFVLNCFNIFRKNKIDLYRKCVRFKNNRMLGDAKNYVRYLLFSVSKKKSLLDFNPVGVTCDSQSGIT